MPKYSVKPETYGEVCAPKAGKSKKHYPTVWIKASAEIIKALEVGKPAVVTLKGVVVGLSSNERPDERRHEFTLELREVEAYTDGKAKYDDEKEPDMKGAIDKALGYAK